MSRILSITFLFLSITLCLHAQHKTSIYFPFGSAELSDTAKHTLTGIGIQSFRVADLSGHTDTVGAAEHNIRLAAARLKAVAVYLKRLHPGATFRLHNEGELSPVNNFDSLNRCVVITLQASTGGSVPAKPSAGKEVVNNGKETSETPVSDSRNELEGVDGAAGTTDSLHPNEILVKKFALENILFEPDRAILTSSSVYIVEQTAKHLLEYQGYSFEVRGHVNFTPDLKVEPGTPPFELSVNRGKLVKRMLIGYGIAADKITARGMGNSELIYPSQYIGRKLKNMRVEVLIYKPKKK